MGIHGEGGSIVQQASGYSERVATVLPVYYPKKGEHKIEVHAVRFTVVMGNVSKEAHNLSKHAPILECILCLCVKHKCVALSGFHLGVGATR